MNPYSAFMLAWLTYHGYPLPQPYLCDTLDVAPGNRYEVFVDATESGAWAFHCHILTHAEGDQGTGEEEK